MTTSGSIDFIVTRDDIITDALELIGVLGEGETPTADQLTSCSRTLNMMVKTWQADGMNLFAIRKQYLFLDAADYFYPLASNTTTHFTESFVSTETTTSASLGESTLYVTSTSGMANGDFIKLIGESSSEWSSINTLVSGTEILLDAPISFDIPDGSRVYTYTSRASRPIKIQDAVIHQDGAGTEIPMTKLSRGEYISLSKKDSLGLPLQLYYDPQITIGELSVWPAPNSSADYLILYVSRTLEDLDAGTDNPDFPQEWYMPLVYGLAVHLAPKYGLPTNDYYIVERQYKALYDQAKYFDVEAGTSLYLRPDRY